MKILFLTMNNFESISEHSIYPDMIRELHARGHEVTVLSPIEKKYNQATNKKTECGINVVKVKTGNLFNVNMIEKLISRAGIARKYQNALDVFCANEKFDLVLYTTPPTTLTPIVKKVKRESRAYAYLMLKDIFPQNAVDLGMIRQNGILFKIFRIGEKKLYKTADAIGCMSPANVNFLRKQDPWIPANKITLCPNAIEIKESAVDNYKKECILKKYQIPQNKLLCIYGGGLGKPQGIEFLKECIVSTANDSDIFYLIIGSGLYYDDLKKLAEEYPNVLKVIKWLPVEEYEKIVSISDVGLIFLNHNFKIPNFPSRLLLYMQSKLPIFAVTDLSTDIGRIAEENGFGYWCESNDINAYKKVLNKFKDASKRAIMGENSYKYLKENYSVEVVVSEVLERVEKQNENSSN